MATVTTAFGQGAQAEQAHVGINAVVCKVSLSASWSSGDVHRIGRIPNGAVPLDAVFYPGPASPVGLIAKFGISASQELFFGSATYSVASRTTRKLGYQMQVSIADDAVVNYDFITMVATAGVSQGYVGDLVVYYKMPGQTA